ncbi:caspase family protein [Lentisphaerota bacterium WC36G]|nr:caspase family protein [Lentisphaerae bacterium WC36]
MTTRRALLIGSPGEEWEDRYCKGVLKDLDNYESFLKSPQGGYWYESEIIRLEKPTSYDVKLKVAEIASYDYTYIVFSGHGYMLQENQYSAPKNILELRQGYELDADELRVNANKRTIVLDCCREVYNISGQKISSSCESFQARAFADSKPRVLNSQECRYYYDKKIDECSNGIITKHSSSIGETSGDDEVIGGHYISSLLESAEAWTQKMLRTGEDRYYYNYNVVTAHNEAKPKTTKKKATQTPYIVKSKSEPYFPFAIVSF